ncbi:MAG: nitrogenase component 1 [Erysipelotrichales bacterium]
MEIAIYGKGGIGKSTMAANISAALSLQGNKVLQIGCDPKHDSTRLLLNDQELTTALDYIKVTKAVDYRIEDILVYGFNNIGCVEAGGPKPGVGCAGRGIISTFELLEQFNIKKKFDSILYDVLGDVVCGGFAVPIRSEYADVVFVVTSGEYMALYAANNILRGIKNYDSEDKPRVAGIIYNKRDIEDEDERIEKFSSAVNLPVVATIPRSDLFAQADRINKSVVELGLDEDLGGIFSDLSSRINNSIECHPACPVSDEELEELIFNKVQVKKEVIQKKEIEENSNSENSKIDFKMLSKNIVHDEPLHGCAFNGAISMAVHLQDAYIIAHSPKSCANLSYQSVSSAGRRGLFERGALLPVSIAPNFEATDMDEADIIFGGMESLEAKVDEVLLKKPKAIVIVSSCPAGIIGDDIDKVISKQTKDTAIYTIKSDGNLAGDYLQGMLMTYTTLAQSFIKKDVPIIDNTVNIVFEKVVAKNTNSNFEIVQSFLNQMGVKVNCRFLSETTVDKLENFCSAPLNLLAHSDYTGMILKGFFIENYNCAFLDRAFPVGFFETKEWLLEVGEFFNKKDKALEIIKYNEVMYYKEIERMKPILRGKKLMIITYNHELDWILKTALDLEIEIVKICILNFSQDTGFRTRIDYPFNVEEDYSGESSDGDVAMYQPDILLTNYANSDGKNVKVADTIPMCPDVGFLSGLNMAIRWANLFNLSVEGEWKDDERLFKKYYSR